MANDDDDYQCSCGYIVWIFCMLACIALTAMLILALATTGVSLIGGVCPMLWEVLTARCCMSVLLSAALMCLKPMPNGEIAYMVYWGGILLYFLVFACVQAVVILHSNNIACTRVLTDTNPLGSGPLLTTLGLVHTGVDSVMAFGALVVLAQHTLCTSAETPMDDQLQDV